ncbi:hypothetical protein GDO81_012621 [Engystomops pustulosus]|uniref:Uncharacterized protein n=1 Tax=Engystomops pustulosus TaxID=76066 RepID=A0AAV7B2V0_ENGPU|nr:hypothetical protein GDO81_012621 [Engystomops pustulosus]
MIGSSVLVGYKLANKYLAASNAPCPTPGTDWVISWYLVGLATSWHSIAGYHRKAKSTAVVEDRHYSYKVPGEKKGSAILV